jgi:hypothetical protein
MKKRFTDLIAVALLALLPTTASAAGARITWSEVPDAVRYKLFVAQPDAHAPTVLAFRIKHPGLTDEGYYFYDVHGLDPLRPAYFLMVSISSEGVSSNQSNIMELGSESFCELFDVDSDGSVDASDALAVARAALGLKHNRINVTGSIILALEILRMVSTLQCG